MYIELAIFALFVFCYSLVAGRLERAPASGPIVFVAAGFLMGPLALAWFDGDVSRTGLRTLADLTLASRFVYTLNSHTRVNLLAAYSDVVDSEYEKWFDSIGIDDSQFWISVGIQWNY